MARRRRRAGSDDGRPVPATGGARPAVPADGPAVPADGAGGKRTSMPRRDERRRVVALVDLLAVTFAGTVIGAVVVVALDGAYALLGLGRFGSGSGWLAGILPVWLFGEEVRAWKGVRGRAAVALLAGVLGLAVAFGVNAATGYLPRLAAGVVAILAGSLLYAVIWYFGIRWLARQVGEEGSSR